MSNCESVDWLFLSCLRDFEIVCGMVSLLLGYW